MDWKNELSPVMASSLVGVMISALIYWINTFTELEKCPVNWRI
jgi:hypothetical protein